MGMQEEYPVGYTHYGTLAKLEEMVGGDPLRVPRAGWHGTLQDLGSLMGLDPEMIARELGYSLADHDDAGAIFEISPPPPRANHHGDLKHIPQWRLDEAYRIDPRTTQDLLRGK